MAFGSGLLDKHIAPTMNLLRSVATTLSFIHLNIPGAVITSVNIHARVSFEVLSALVPFNDLES